MKTAASFLVLLPGNVLAWGSLGHQTVAYVAQKYVSADTTKWAQGILGSTGSGYLADVATWADSYRYTTAGKFSAPFHYIDAQDNPPSTCGVDFDRDCGEGGCIVSAIQNYTARIQDKGLSAANHKEALEFLVHFFGDVTQPLHDEAHEVGGNGISVKFNGKTSNLHHIWDTEMPEKIVGGNTTTDASKWATQLSTSIDSGDYSKDKSTWVAGMSLDNVQTSIMAMAKDANSFVCTAALKGGDDAVEGKELSGAYYENAAPVISEQIAKGGYRLAGWLNLLATGKLGLDDEMYSSSR